jgi:hypothetical protein
MVLFDELVKSGLMSVQPMCLVVAGLDDDDDIMIDSGRSKCSKVAAQGACIGVPPVQRAMLSCLLLKVNAGISGVQLHKYLDRTIFRAIRRR